MGIFDLFKSKPAEPEKTPAEAKAAAEMIPTPEMPADVLQAGGVGASASAAPTPAPAPAGLFSRFKAALKRTNDLLNTDIRDLFKKEGRLVDDDFLSELFAILIKTDIGVGPANDIREEIKTSFRGRVVQMTDVLDVIKRKVRELLKQEETPLRWASEGTTVILVVGVNGAGKTTSIAKLAHYCKQMGKSVVLGAGDTFRAAAVEQLSIWAQRIGAEIATGEPGSDPAAVAHRAAARAKEINADVCIIDTAGRLQTQANLMQQLEKIHRVIAKQIAGAPHEVLLVLDATAGQNAISQAQGFSQAAHCTGIVLAKLDGTAKGGVVIPIRQKFEIPVKFIGLGESVEDFAAFQSDQFVDALFAEQIR